MKHGKSSTIRRVQALAAAVESNPTDVEKVHRAVKDARAERALGVLEQAVGLADNAEIRAAMRNLRSDADTKFHELTRAAAAEESDDDGDDDDDDDVDWQEVAFIAIMIFTL